MYQIPYIELALYLPDQHQSMSAAPAAEPPDIGEDYIFPGTSAARGNTSTIKDAVPDYSYLLRWYEEAFTFYQACDIHIVTSYLRLYPMYRVLHGCHPFSAHSNK